MENQIRSSLPGIRIIIFGVLLSFVGCATSRKAASPTEPASQTPSQTASLPTDQAPESAEPQSYGPPSPEAQPQYGPVPVSVQPIVLVLGPGLARGYAYAGVIRALHEAKVNIAGVLGTEMGAFIGALYACSENINQFEWSLQKFKEGLFITKSSFFPVLGEGATSGQAFEDKPREIFGNKKIEECNIPLRIAIQSKDTHIPIILEEGNLMKAVRGALAVTGMFAPSKWTDPQNGDEIEVVSANSLRPFLVSEGKNLHLGPVIAVNVLTDTESASSKQELQQADLMIKPELKRVGYKDFGKKTDAAFSGKQATLQKIDDIKKLVGLLSKE